MMTDSSKERCVTAVIETRVVKADGPSVISDEELLSEYELLIGVNGIPHCRSICTETDIKELCIGRLFSDGVISGADKVRRFFFDRARHEAGAEIANDDSETDGAAPVGALSGSAYYKKEWIFHLADEFRTDTGIHSRTSGTHSCMLARAEDILFRCEDISRRNAADKAVGYMLINRIPPGECLLFTSGRVSSDMVLKAVHAQIPVLVSKSTVTSEAVRLAKRYGITLIGKAWPDAYTIMASARDV